MFPPLEESEIRLILAAAGFSEAGDIKKLPVGFSNDVYEFGGQYIIKFGKSEEDEAMLRKEHYFVNLFKEKLPVAPIEFSDFSGHILNRPFIVYKKIPGKTLFEAWHEMSERKRKSAVMAIAQYLRIVNETPYREYIELFNIDIKRSWEDAVTMRIEENIRITKNRKMFTLGEVELIDRYVLLNKDVLKVSRMALTYYDPHFDNFLVDEDGRIVAMLDFERTDFFCIDYALDLVKRMVEYPTKYASEEGETRVRKEDFAHILEWFQEGYPELFDFPEMEKRLGLYSLDHDLNELLNFPQSKRAREEILGRIGSG